MNNQAVDLYQYLFKNYISYDSLFALNKRAFYERSDADSVDIFIDMHSLIKDLFSNNFSFSYKSTSVITSSIINLCAHIRNYYYTRHRVWAKFYIVWSWNRPDNVRGVLPEYNAHQIMAEDAKTIEKELVNENIKLLETICPYLPGIYFFNGGNHETTTVIATLIENIKKPVVGSHGIPNIIYTKDSYAYLAVNLMPLTFIFRPKKSKGADVSYMVSKTNLIESYIEKELKQVKHTRPWENRIHDYLAYSGMKSKGIAGVLRFKQAIDWVSNEKKLYFSNEEKDRISKLYMAFDLAHQMDIFKNSIDYFTLNKGFIDLVSPEEVKKLNNVYMTEYPLDLNAL